MKTAVMYGAGNIGRGFIGTLFSASGYHTVFVDVAEPVVETLNRDHAYPVRILAGDACEDIFVKNVSAVYGNDVLAVAEAIASSEIVATAVGVNVLPRIVPNLVAGIRLRKSRNGGDLNILICENLMDAHQVLRQMIRDEMSSEEFAWVEEHVGLVETSIGRMVPIQTEDMKDGAPLRVCVERYGFLPVDKAAFKGGIPEIRNMIPFDPFDFYVKRKLYIHNMGHAVCAYLGDLLGCEYISQSIDDPEVCILVRGAMLESARALSSRYGVDLSGLLVHIDDLLFRFTNQALRDTCRRVGGDPKRKLSPKDRLIGAGTLCLAQGVDPVYIAVGAAAALYRMVGETEGAVQSRQTAEMLLRQASGEVKEPLAERVLSFYEEILRGSSVGALRRKADALLGVGSGTII